jgi:hypothetical protein
MISVAEPVDRSIGSRPPDGTVDDDVFGEGVDFSGTEDELVDVDGESTAALLDVCGGVGVGEAAGFPDVQAVRRAAPAVHTVINAALRVRPTRPDCHVTPIKIRGCADGVSQRMIVMRFDCGMETQPAVGPPSVTCRKKALPA